MNWLKSKTKRKQLNARFANAEEIRGVFGEINESLYWTALTITGKHNLAAESVVNAAELAQTNSNIFREWLVRWANIASARTAIQRVDESIRHAAQAYLEKKCSHPTHELLADEEISELHRVNPLKIVDSLDPFARAVLILHGCQHISIQDCSLLLRVPAKCVIPAYCAALDELFLTDSLSGERALSCGTETQSDSNPSFIRRKEPCNVVPSI